MQQIRRNPEQITLAFSSIHFRQFGGEETAVALLEQIVGNVAASRNAQKVGRERPACPIVEDAEGFTVLTQLVSGIRELVFRLLRELEASRASLWPEAHRLLMVFPALSQQTERLGHVVGQAR